MGKDNEMKEREDVINLNIGAEAYQKGDYETAIKYYEKSANAGNVIALSNLGYCYYYGRSIPVDKKKAKECWEKAAILGDIAAVYKLGDMYRNGEIEKNLEYSRALYVRAFEMALESDDIGVCPDAFLRMLKYYPEEIEQYYYTQKEIAKSCVSMLEERIAKGDNYSGKVLKEANAILQKLG